MADQILFDKLIYIDRLKRAGVADDQARAHAEAMDEALREAVATKSDLRTAVSDLEHKIELAVRDMTIRTGVMATAIVAILTAIKFFT